MRIPNWVFVAAFLATAFHAKTFLYSLGALFLFFVIHFGWVTIKAYMVKSDEGEQGETPEV